MIKEIWNNFKDALFPRDIKCIACDRELSHENRYCLCDECLKSLPRSASHVCQKCGESLDSMADYCMSCKDHIERYFTLARAPLLYDGIVIKLIHDLKYHNKQFVGEYLSRMIVDEFIKHNFDVDVVVPIPLNPNREKQRGYNQALLISVSFEKELGLPIDTVNFVRTVDTPTQTQLSKEERKHNLEHAFKVINKTFFKNKKVLLIDDVYTTGATMEEASKALIDGGAKEVYCLSVAHTMPIYLRKQREAEKKNS